MSAQISGLGHDIADVRVAVLSHLHQDHIGGLPELSHADILVSGREWDSLQRPLAELRGLLRSHIELPGLRWTTIDPEPISSAALAPFTSGHDIFGDGSLVLLPTPGHTPGSMSLLVTRTGAPPLLLVGDLTYDDDLLVARKVPGVGNKRELRRTADLVNDLRARHPGLVVLPAHDPGAAQRLTDASVRTSHPGVH